MSMDAIGGTNPVQGCAHQHAGQVGGAGGEPPKVDPPKTETPKDIVQQGGKAPADDAKKGADGGHDHGAIGGAIGGASQFGGAISDLLAKLMDLLTSLLDRLRGTTGGGPVQQGDVTQKGDATQGRAMAAGGWRWW